MTRGPISTGGWSTTPLLQLSFSAALVLMMSSLAAAQPVATSFPELKDLLKRGNTIYVTEAGGRRTKGTVGEVSPSTLELLVRKRAFDGSESLVPLARLTENDVTQILVERRDPPWRGLLIGLGAVGGPWAIICSTGCTYNEYGAENMIRISALITTGIAAGIGALVDAAIVQRTMVYYKVSTSRPVAVEFSPLLAPSAAGVQASLRF